MTSSGEYRPFHAGADYTPRPQQIQYFFVICITLVLYGEYVYGCLLVRIITNIITSMAAIGR